MWNVNPGYRPMSWPCLVLSPFPGRCLMPGAAAFPVLPGCLAPGWGGGMGTGCQALPCCPGEPPPPLAPNLKKLSVLIVPCHDSSSYDSIEISVFHMFTFVMLWVSGVLISSSCGQLKWEEVHQKNCTPKEPTFPSPQQGSLISGTGKNLKSSGVNPILHVYLVCRTATRNKGYPSLQDYVARM